MKQTETIFKAKKRYIAIMILCFLFGGFSFTSFILQAYTVFWQTEMIGFPFVEGRVARLAEGAPDFNSLGQQDFNRAGPGLQGRDPIAQLTSPVALFWLVGGIVAILAGIAIWSLIREKEIKSVRQEITNNLLLPDEKAIIDELKKSDYSSTQAKLVRETGLGKVQVHRVINRLEAKGIVEKHEYGLTNKIILKKEFFK